MLQFSSSVFPTQSPCRIRTATYREREKVHCNLCRVTLSDRQLQRSMRITAVSGLAIELRIDCRQHHTQMSYVHRQTDRQTDIHSCWWTRHICCCMWTTGQLYIVEELGARRLVSSLLGNFAHCPLYGTLDGTWMTYTINERQGASRADIGRSR